MTTEMVLMRGSNGRITLGLPSPFGILSLIDFASFEELRKFAMGILGYCEYYHPEVPSVYLRAFEDKEETNGKGN